MNGKKNRRGGGPGHQGLALMTAQHRELHGHALLWAFILPEVYSQVSRHEGEVRKREDEVEQYFPGQNPPEVMVRIVHEVVIPGSSVTPGAVVVELRHEVDKFPNRATLVVRFALCRLGQVRRDSVRIEHGHEIPWSAKFPPIVRIPATADEARDLAATLVRQGIAALVSEAERLRGSGQP
jgi:hypothetical protein